VTSTNLAKSLVKGLKETKHFPANGKTRESYFVYKGGKVVAQAIVSKSFVRLNFKHEQPAAAMKDQKVKDGATGGRNRAAEIEPLVPAELWAAAQVPGRAWPSGNGRTRAVLLGLIRCGGCGHRLHATGRGPSSSCRGKFATGLCPARAVAQCSRVDGYMLFLLQQPEVLEAISSSAADVETRYLAARDAVERAEAELEAFITSASVIADRQLFVRGVEARQATLDEARRVLWETPDPGVPEGIDVIYLDGKPLLLEAWAEMGIDRQRQHIRRLADSVTLHRADPSRRKHQPIEERVEVRWVGESPS
jgi:hypothetical protein